MKAEVNEEATRNYLHSAFREYYEALEAAHFPSRGQMREFAFMTFDGAVLRHLTFADDYELLAFLRVVVPRNVYYSAAWYEKPGAPDMVSKGWVGADLIFDIDADELELDCQEVHKVWKCPACNLVYESEGVCERCKGPLTEVNLPCSNCLRGAAEEVRKLLEVLEEDLGVSRKDVFVTFSSSY